VALSNHRSGLIVKDNTQERTVDVKSAVVPDEAELLEFVQKRLTRRRVVPIISASTSCDTFGTTFSGWFSLPYRAAAKYGPIVSPLN
jgi:hypothetical protein